MSRGFKRGVQPLLGEEVASGTVAWGRSRAPLLVFRLIAFSALFAFVVLVALGCESGPEPDPLAALGESERHRLDSFIAEIRGGFERGDARAVERLINDRGVPDYFAKFARVRFLPKGPMKVLGTRVEPIRGKGGSLEVGDTTFEFNVDPLGFLVIDMDDVSVGNVNVRMAIGTMDGQLYIAGWKPRD